MSVSYSYPHQSLDGNNYYRCGNWLSIFVNQGLRDAWILGIIGDQMIVEYEMPSGTTALTIFNTHKQAIEYVRSVSYKSCPKIWIQAIKDGQGEWQGNSQSGEVRFPE